MLLTVIASLPFLAGLAMALFALDATLRANARKIIGALRGESPLATALETRPVTVRFTPRTERSRPARHVEPRWRAAA